MPAQVVDLRIAVVQFSPKIGQVKENMRKAREICSKIEPKSIDLLCFSEMVFSGYVFEHSSDILPYLEDPKTGPTSQFCSEMARELGCYVIAGYPERLSEKELDEIAAESKARGGDYLKTDDGREIHRVGANSVVLVGPDGSWVGGYRKINHFETDETWAKAGDEFTSFTLPLPLKTLSIGVCRDINPHEEHGRQDGGPFEIADYCLSKNTDVLVLLNAWTDSKKKLEEDKDWSTLNHWAARMKPLWTDGKDENAELRSGNASEAPQGEGHDTIVVVANRCGEENGKH
ncbi:hypothetical protein D9613_006199 [Agrocybe pediades]|uniref:CN hydrolase domain-containing protein n=1 Tax=Agrocybe pediades TaxID=84607 RepID=A0A8H4QW57_9AGAR|nr:hypothetical protein D9613_006199 [Agrocybe pediades]